MRAPLDLKGVRAPRVLTGERTPLVLKAVRAPFVLKNVCIKTKNHVSYRNVCKSKLEPKWLRISNTYYYPNLQSIHPI